MGHHNKWHLCKAFSGRHKCSMLESKSQTCTFLKTSPSITSIVVLLNVSSLHRGFEEDCVSFVATKYLHLAP